MLIDEITINVKAGDGGDGAVAFNKNLMSLGPAGGSGGRGGSVYAEGVSNLNALNTFRFKKEVRALDGENGRSQFRDGPDAKDVVIFLPVGTVIHNETLGKDTEIVKIGEKILIADGGRGGRGNFQFRSSINTTPKQFERGRPGEEFKLTLELKMIADVGFVGLPNVGKSSLLNELTEANIKVANYAFTTLEPNLGVYYELILADLPGLIENASSGKGLGIKFLRHVERTRILFHLVACDSESPIDDYKTIRNELGKYNKTLLDKPEYIFLSKYDNISKERLGKLKEKFKKLNPKVIPLSIYDDESIEEVKKILNKIKEDKISKSVS